jgi:2-amino-4-hydroxy-6-hydroxymethyldihydropteridine diphosphokinase
MTPAPAPDVDARPDLPAWAVVTPPRAAHVARVVALVDRWAVELGVDPAEAARWRRAALYHDALRDAGPEVLARYEPQAGWPRSLWHGPAAAAAAARAGEADPGVLDAVRFHSVGHAGWDDAGRMLFMADYLEPGRIHDRSDLDALIALVPHQPREAFREVAARRIGWLLRHGRPIPEVTWEFWNSLVADDSSSRG